MRTIKLVSTGWLILIGAIGATAIARYCGLEYPARHLAIFALGIVSGVATGFVGYRHQ